MPRVRLRVDYYGRTRKYGPSTYKVSSDAVPLLTAEGWQVVHRASYVYVAPPSEAFKGTPVVTVEVPEDAEIERLAADLHGRREKAGGEIGLWPYRYAPAHDYTSTMTTIAGQDFLRNLSLTSRKPVGQQMAEGMAEGRIPFRIKRTEHHSPATFRIGRSLLWDVTLTWAAGDDQPPTWGRSLDHILPDPAT
jgi:hypothetical protein